METSPIDRLVVTPDRPPLTARKHFMAAEEKKEGKAFSPAWEEIDFLRLTAQRFENHIAVADIDTAGIRLGHESYEGDFRFRGALKPDALYLAFGGGDGVRMMGRAHRQPVLSIVGPGSELDVVQHGRHTRFS